MNDDHNLEERLTKLDTERAKLILEINSLRNKYLTSQKDRPTAVLLGRPLIFSFWLTRVSFIYLTLD